MLVGMGNPNVDPHENLYLLGGYGFLGLGPGTARSTWGFFIIFYILCHFIDMEGKPYGGPYMHVGNLVLTIRLAKHMKEA